MLTIFVITLSVGFTAVAQFDGTAQFFGIGRHKYLQHYEGRPLCIVNATMHYLYGPLSNLLYTLHLIYKYYAHAAADNRMFSLLLVYVSDTLRHFRADQS